MKIPRSKYDEAVEMTKGVLEGISCGDPADRATMIGPLINQAQLDKVQGYVDRAVADGARVVVGGKRPDDRPDGFFFEPTLIADVDNSSAIAQEEIFGPVLVAIAFDDDDDAVRIANDSIFGLSGAVYSANDERADAVARRLRVGTVSVNGGMYYGPDAPFGGYKQSGFGREMGIAGLEEYLNYKTIARPAG